MSPAGRRVLFAVSMLVLLPLLAVGFHDLPAFGAQRPSYGERVGRLALDERHVTNLVSAVVFDYRGLDTMGEEMIMFAAVTGVLLLLRGARGETGLEPGLRTRAWAAERRSDATTAFGRWLLGVVALFGLYTVAHGQVTPGGGFQGGVMIAGAFLLIWLADGYRLWRLWTPVAAFDLAEALSAGAFVAIGLIPLLVGASFLANWLPLGRPGTPFSGGTIALLNAAVGVEVAAAFVLLFSEFLEETRRSEPGESG